MIKLKFLPLIIILLAGSIWMSSCKKTLDINNDPTMPTTGQITTNALLPSGMMWIASAVGGDLQLIGSIWAQHYAQGNTSNQYNSIDQYNLTSSSSYTTRTWSLLYAGAIPDLDQTIQIAAQQGKWNYWVPAMLMKAYTYQILTDAYGDVPFTEVDKGIDVLAPKLDNSQTVIYPDIIKLIDSALAKITDASKVDATTPIGKTDIVFQGDWDAWKRFAYTLKLKILMRTFTDSINDINAILTDANNLLLDKDAKIAGFVDAPNRSNPLYENDQRKLNTPVNLRASQTTLNYLDGVSDPRIPFYYREGILEDGVTPGYIAIPQGQGPNGYQNEEAYFSRALLEATDPVYFISLAETQFMVAECYARLNNFSNTQAWYDNAVKSAFARWGLDATYPTNFIGLNGEYELKNDGTELTKILTQKWLASVRCQGWNAFIDINRTGIPGLTNTNTYAAGKLVRSATSVLAVGKYPKRMLYPKTSSDYNVNAADANTKLITDELWWENLP